MKRVLFILMIMGTFINCNPFGPIGPNRIRITVSGGVQPVISWNGGAVTYVSVELPDSLVGETLPDGSIGRRPAVVWGYRAYDSTGKNVNGIVSPVRVGTDIANATDISDSSCRTGSLVPGVRYKISMATVGPGACGFIRYTP